MTTSPSKRTVTDKLCDQAKRQVMRRLESEYEKAFPHKAAGDEFFVKLATLEGKVHDYLLQRPMTKAEINSVVTRSVKAGKIAIREAAKKVTQPQYRECVDIETGEVRLIPDYDD
jgi:hypothetical protein